MMEKSKKLLIISSYAPHGSGGSPNMLYNLIQHFPQDRTSLLTSHWNTAPAIRLPLPFRSWYYDEKDETKSSSDSHLAIWMKKRLPTPLTHFLGKFRGNIQFFRQLRKLLRVGTEVLQAEDIGHLLLCSDGGIALLGGHNLSSLFRKPYSLLMMDLYRQNTMLLQSLYATEREKRLFCDASRVYVMGESLQQYFQNHFKANYCVLPNSVTIPPSSPSFEQSALRSPFVVLYSGSIYWAQADAFEALIRAVGSLPWARLEVFTPQNVKNLYDIDLCGPNVSWGFLPQKELLLRQSMADALYLPLSFKKAFRTVVETATASKLYEYMLSGRAILVHAPDYAFVSRYARQEKFALVVDDPSPSALRQGLQELRDHPLLCEKLARRAWEVVANRHNAKINMEELHRDFFPEED